LKDRNIELGECFDKSISFISCEDGVLRWESCADEECKKILTYGYSVIKQLVREIFGFETKIKHEACSKVAPEVPEKPQEIELYEPSSMIEESEMGPSASCVSNCQSSDSTREIDGAKILEEPMVQRATELFEATKITIQSKI
jgi:DNA polymerase-3 subunit gamma/tau